MKNHREIDSPEVTYGTAYLIITYDDEPVDSFDIPSANPSSNYQESINTEKYPAEYNGKAYQISITSSNVGTYIYLETDTDLNLNKFDLNIEPDIEDDVINNLKSNNRMEEFYFNFYAPCIPFTNTTSAVLYGLADDKSVIPLVDIETNDQFASYLKDDMMDFLHFLDLGFMKDLSNRQKRESVKKMRKEEKAELGEMKTAIPKPAYHFTDISDQVNNLKSIGKKDLVIPVYRWESTEDHATDNLKDFEKFIRQMNDTFEDIGIRVHNINSFLNNIERIGNLGKYYLFLDLNTNFDIDKISKIIRKIKEYSFKKIIYLGAHFNTSDMSISRNETNTNKIFTNQPLEVFHQLRTTEEHHDIGYGDYCGFDRKTIVILPRGGMPTARVVLSSLDKVAQILIRRSLHEDDIVYDSTTGSITTFKLKKSMKQLLCDIKDGKLDVENSKKFIDEEICDADYSLKDYCPETTSPAMIKTLCFRHNIFSIKNNFISETVHNSVSSNDW